MISAIKELSNSIVFVVALVSFIAGVVYLNYELEDHDTMNLEALVNKYLPNSH